MPVVVLTDGSPEMMNLLDSALASHVSKATQVVRLVDFWHFDGEVGAGRPPHPRRAGSAHD